MACSVGPSWGRAMTASAGPPSGQWSFAPTTPPPGGAEDLVDRHAPRVSCRSHLGPESTHASPMTVSDHHRARRGRPFDDPHPGPAKEVAVRQGEVVAAQPADDLGQLGEAHLVGVGAPRVTSRRSVSRRRCSRCASVTPAYPPPQMTRRLRRIGRVFPPDRCAAPACSRRSP